MNTSYLILGGNVGNMLENLRLAVESIERRVGPTTKKSSIFVTAAWGKKDQADFYNQAICVETELEAEHLLETLLAIEMEMGRKRGEKWAARTIDIDILFYNSELINSINLQVPHPHLQDRRFVLEPLAEIAEKFIHPKFNKSIHQLLNECSDQLMVKRLSTS